MDLIVNELNPAGQQIMQQAADIARSLGEYEVGTEHVLLAILRDPENEAARILTSLGHPLAAIDADVTSQLLSSTREEGELVLTPRTRRVLRFAQMYTTREVGPTHILIGLICDAEGLAGRVLIGRYGIDAGQIFDRQASL